MGATPSSTKSGKTNQDKKKSRERKKLIEHFFICIEAGAIEPVQDLLKMDTTLLYETPPKTLPNLLSMGQPLTPIHIAVCKCHSNLTKMFLKIDPTLANQSRKGLLMDILGSADFPIQSTSLYNSCDLGNRNIILKLLLEAQSDVNCTSSATYSAPILKALYAGRMDFVDLLLEYKADLNCVSKGDIDGNGMNGLQILLNYHIPNSDTVKRFLEIGADPNYKNLSLENSLHVAIRRNLENVISPLLEASVDIGATNSTGHTPIQSWINYPMNIMILDRLIKAGSNMNIMDASGNTLLHLACQCYSASEEVLNKLLDYGFNPNVKNASNQSSFDLVLSSGSKGKFGVLLKRHGHIQDPLINRCLAMSWVDTVETMVDMGADVNSQDSFGNQMSPLHYCCTYGHHLLLSKLIDAGANVNVQDTNGDTPLHISVQRSDRVSVKCLLEAGTNLELKNNRGYTPKMMCTGDMDLLFSEFM